MTEDEPASASLLRSAERYRSLFEAIPDLVFTKDQDLRFSQVNPAMEKTLGLSASEIVGHAANDLRRRGWGSTFRRNFRVLSETIEEEHGMVNGENLAFHEVRVRSGIAPENNRSAELVETLRATAMLNQALPLATFQSQKEPWS
jgi:PAS domain S-box-containing protein